MIDYINIYNQLNKLAELRAKVNTYYSAKIRWDITLTIGISILAFYLIVNMTNEIKGVINKYIHIKSRHKTNKILYLIAIVMYIITIAITIKSCIINSINTKNEIKTTNDSEVINTAVKTNIISESTASEMYTTNEIADLLRVNGVSNIELFKQNIEYLKGAYDKKVKTFKLLYNKNTDVYESDYINAILNQFYLGKIGADPADMTGFEEDYPHVSTGLKK